MQVEKILDKVLRKKLAVELSSAINDLVRDPDFFFRIIGITLRNLRSSLNSRLVHILVIKVETNNRPLLLGQFINFRFTHMRGFHIEYLTAKVEAILREAINNLDCPLEVHFDVTPAQGRPLLEYVYRPLDLEVAVALGMLSRDSRLYREMKRYELTSVILAGCEISGPNYAMIKAVEKICATSKVKKCMDLFAGTGSLTKVALKNKASFVDCVDVNTGLITLNLQQFQGRYSIHNVDAFDFRHRGQYDLLILDPFYDFTLDVAQKLLPKYSGKVNMAILNMGLRINRYWISKIKTHINKISPSAKFEDIGENTIGFIKLS